MEGPIVFEDHAVRRISERLKITPAHILELLEEKAYAVAGEVTDYVSKIRCKYVVIWDQRVQAPFLLILEERVKGVWTLVTAYATMPFHKRQHGVMVMYQHINIARRLSRQQGYNKNGMGPGMVRLYIHMRIPCDGRWKARNVFLGFMRQEKYESTYGSVKSYLSDMLTNEKIETFEVPEDSDVSVVLYHYPASRKREVLERMVIVGEPVVLFK